MIDLEELDKLERELSLHVWNCNGDLRCKKCRELEEKIERVKNG
jgi:hypothetical protein